MVNKHPSLSDLPEELLVQVACELDSESQLALTSTSRTLRRICHPITFGSLLHCPVTTRGLRLLNLLAQDDGSLAAHIKCLDFTLIRFEPTECQPSLEIALFAATKSRLDEDELHYVQYALLVCRNAQQTQAIYNFLMLRLCQRACLSRVGLVCGMSAKYFVMAVEESLRHPLKEVSITPGYGSDTVALEQVTTFLAHGSVQTLRVSGATWTSTGALPLPNPRTSSVQSLSLDRSELDPGTVALLLHSCHAVHNLTYNHQRLFTTAGTDFDLEGYAHGNQAAFNNLSNALELHAGTLEHLAISSHCAMHCAPAPRIMLNHFERLRGLTIDAGFLTDQHPRPTVESVLPRQLEKLCLRKVSDFRVIELLDGYDGILADRLDDQDTFPCMEQLCIYTHEVDEVNGLLEHLMLDLDCAVLQDA